MLYDNRRQKYVGEIIDIQTKVLRVWKVLREILI